MRSFDSTSGNRVRAGSSVALALALLTGTAMLSGIIAEPAHAQRNRDNDRNNDERPQYSREFIEAFTPLQEAVNAQDGSAAGIIPQFQPLLALVASPDERNAAGGLIYNTGAQTNDQDLQLQGMSLMLESGKVAPEQVGRFNFIAYQLSNARGEHARARGFLQAAIDLNFTTDTVAAADLQIAMAESFIAEERFRDGVSYLSNAIASRSASGQPVEETWYRRGLSVAYNNEIVPEVYDFVGGWVAAYPSEANWRDAINIARNLNEFESSQMLDLLRLSQRVGALKEKYEYVEYVEAADARRLPNEVKHVIEEAYASGIVSQDDIYVSDSLETANGRIESDLAELPALESDARAADAPLRTIVAAGDAFLNYAQYDKAEEFYAKAAGMTGVDREEVLTRLGIAQLEQGKFDEARASFGQVGGTRLQIARLWNVYVGEREAAASASEPAPAPAEDTVAALN